MRQERYAQEHVTYKKPKKRKRRRRNRGWKKAGIFLGILLLAAVMFFGWFRVTDIKITGSSRYEDAAILPYVQEELLTSNTMLVSWFCRHIEIIDLPFVESVDLEVLDHHTIRAYVNEKQLIAHVVDGDQKLYFDKDGYILEIEALDGKGEIQGEETAQTPGAMRVLGLNVEKRELGQKIQTGQEQIFNSIWGIWRMTLKNAVVPQLVLLDESYNITLVYQEETILCQIGQDEALEEKLTRLAAILPHLQDKTGILHLEEYTTDKTEILFSEESQDTIKNKISGFL